MITRQWQLVPLVPDVGDKVTLTDEAMAVLAAFVHLPCEEHEQVFASDRSWEQLRRAFPEQLIAEALANCPDFSIEEG